MVSLLVSILILVLGYFIYGTYVEKKFGADKSRPTPVKTMADGVDYVELPLWRLFMIQFLNIAGLGPIFGAILGAKYGTASYIWIVLGCVFMGSIHDYFSGMMSIRNKGASMPEIIGKYLGKGFKQFSRLLTFFLLVIVGAAFVNGPAGLLTTLTEGFLSNTSWVVIIMVYYIAATLLPIDKIIGSIYPFFGAALLIMALGIGGYMIFGGVSLIEISSDTFRNFQTNPTDNILYPMLFIVISCGAISGFHSTQSPLIARCLTNESHGKKAFWGAMTAEGVLALIWATAAINYFGGPEQLNANLDMHGNNPAWLVNLICNTWMGHVGAILAIIGVIACPITTGDTAFRSARLLAADAFKINQKGIVKRVLVSLPILAVGFALSRVNFPIIWKYVGITNQLLAVIILWTAAAFMAYNKKTHWILSIPAAILTNICISYFIIAPYNQGGLFLGTSIGIPLGIIGGILAFIIFLIYAKRLPNKVLSEI